MAGVETIVEMARRHVALAARHVQQQQTVLHRLRVRDCEVQVAEELL